MKRFNLGTLALSFSLLSLAFGGAAVADDDHMKVIEDTKDLKKHMKNFSKGLGVKCTACHVKKDWESEKEPNKDKSRFFFRETVEVTDAKARDAALKKLLALLELDAAKDETKLWKGIDGMKRKK